MESNEAAVAVVASVLVLQCHEQREGRIDPMEDVMDFSSLLHLGSLECRVKFIRRISVLCGSHSPIEVAERSH